jgi:carbon-monoxide dehydrogenase small subunit
MHMTGRIAQFGRSLAGDVSKDMFSQFTAALDATARGEEPVAGGAPPSAVQMTVRLITSRARAIVQRIKRKD